MNICVVNSSVSFLVDVLQYDVVCPCIPSVCCL